MRKLTTFHYVDIHSHILYGVDDGPDNIETSIEMMKIAYDEGYSQDCGNTTLSSW